MIRTYIQCDYCGAEIEGVYFTLRRESTKSEHVDGYHHMCAFCYKAIKECRKIPILDSEDLKNAKKKK